MSAKGPFGRRLGKGSRSRHVRFALIATASDPEAPCRDGPPADIALNRMGHINAVTDEFLSVLRRQQPDGCWSSSSSLIVTLAAGVAVVLDRRSKPDLRSVWDRLSPTVLFSSSVRVPTPLRRSLPERRPTFDRLSSTAMIVSPKINRYVSNDGEANENSQMSWGANALHRRLLTEGPL